jgi:uncharacterized membrane protein YhhN
MKQLNRLPVLYFVLLLSNILFAEFDISIGHTITKPLLMPILGLVFYGSGKSGLKTPVYLALFFAWLGDIFLMFSGQNFFLMGLSSFLLAHLTYSYIFSKRSNFRLIGLLPLGAYALMFSILILQDAIPADMKIPVYFYICAITLMTFMASTRDVKSESFGLVLAGAVLFMLSDSIIAIDDFKDKVNYSSLWIMSTYGLGQFLIIKGLIKENEQA